MCQLCVLNNISQSSRWPKPLESLIFDLQLLVNTAHLESVRYKPFTIEDAKDKATSTAPTTTTKITITSNSSQTTKPSLLTTLRDIKTLLELLEEERTTWW